MHYRLSVRTPEGEAGMMLNPLQQKGFRQLFDAAADALFLVDASGMVAALNPEAERLFGWTAAELVGSPLNRVIPPRFHQVTQLRPSTARQSPDVAPHVAPQNAPVGLFARRRDGSEFPAEFSHNPVGIGEDPLMLVTIRDLTRWRVAQDTLFREKERASVTLASIGDAVISSDLAGTITYLNPAAERLTGWRANEALGQPLSTVLPLIYEATRQPVASIAARCLREGRAVDLSDGVLLLRRDGTEVAIGDSAAPIQDRNGATIGVVLVFHDVTERRRVTRKLSHDATHDSLTGLISRQAFEQRLARVLVEFTSGASEHALCFLDLDRFKVVNDTCGHEAGDDLLRKIGRLLVGQLRSRDTVGRLGGDEFGILLEHCSLDKAAEITSKLLRAIEDIRYTWGERSFSIGASIGVVPIKAANERTADVLRAADHACYAAKSAGGGRVHLAQEVDPAVRQQVETRRMTRLSRAVEEGGLQLFVQPIVSLVPQGPSRPRCEILLGMPGENGGVESLDSFLPEADRLRLTTELDRWVVRQTVERIGEWYRGHPDCELPLCSINLNVTSLDDADLVAAVRESLEQHRIPPEALCFEIAEAAALHDFARLLRLMAEIRAVGCGVGLDDFGSGVSSFVHLKGLPVDYVKIGGHYVRGVVADPVYGALVRTVNEIARIMRITTIAVEVENEAILQELRSLGLGYAQGYAVAPALPLVNAEGEVALPCVLRAA